LKEGQRRRRFADDDEVKEVVQYWLRTKPKTIFSFDGIRKLVEYWTKFIEK
jgi:hypothetical protein